MKRGVLMDIGTIIILVLYVVGAIIAFKLLKSIAKAMFLVSLVGLILIGLLSFFLYQDAMDLKENWPDSQKLLLLDMDGEIIAGVQATFTAEAEPKMLDESELGTVQTSYAADDLESVKADNYKIIIMKFEPMIAEIEAGSLELRDTQLSKTEAERVLRADNALEEFTNIIIDKEGLEKRDEIINSIGEELGSSAKVKALMFGLLFQQLSEEKGAETGLYIFEEYKGGNIIIYPETAIFKFMKYVPQFVLDKAAGIVKTRVSGEA